MREDRQAITCRSFRDFQPPSMQKNEALLSSLLQCFIFLFLARGFCLLGQGGIT